MKFANQLNSWLNLIMRNSFLKNKIKFSESHLDENNIIKIPKSTDINVLLNRVKINQKNESRKKLFFSAAASTGLILFGLIIF
tara:strand:+ start:200 stop:448 length:249 start_codon:yes stop_codon:yes gene_type:complete